MFVKHVELVCFVEAVLMELLVLHVTQQQKLLTQLTIYAKMLVLLPLLVVLLEHLRLKMEQ